MKTNEFNEILDRLRLYLNELTNEEKENKLYLLEFLVSLNGFTENELKLIFNLE